MGFFKNEKENILAKEKIIYISKFVIETLNYDYLNYNLEKEGKGIIPEREYIDLIYNGIGVCRDYAALTQHLLEKVGVKCDCIRSDSEKGGGHAFNIVYIDNIPYYLDNTWEQKNSNLAMSNYFLVSTNKFLETHSDYLEVKRHDCPSDYNRNEILEAQEKEWMKFSEEDVIKLDGLNLSSISHDIQNSIK